MYLIITRVQHHSNETSIIALTDSLNHSLDNHKSLQLLFIDITAAFNTIDFILLSILSKIGITGTAFNWFKYFITQSTKRVGLSMNTGKTKYMSYNNSTV